MRKVPLWPKLTAVGNASLFLDKCAARIGYCRNRHCYQVSTIMLTTMRLQAHVLCLRYLIRGAKLDWCLLFQQEPDPCYRSLSVSSVNRLASIVSVLAGWRIRTLRLYVLHRHRYQHLHLHLQSGSSASFWPAEIVIFRWQPGSICSKENQLISSLRTRCCQLS